MDEYFEEIDQDFKFYYDLTRDKVYIFLVPLVKRNSWGFIKWFSDK